MVDSGNNMDKGEIGIDVGSKRDISVMSTWRRNEDTGKMEIINVEPQIIEVEAEEVHEEEYVDATLYGMPVKKRIIPPLSELNARAKFNQLNKRKPKQDFSWEELEELTNQNEQDL